MISGQDVRQWRQRVGLSVRGLAKLLHVCNSTLFRWESGRSCLSPRNQVWMQVLIFETARRQPRHRDMNVCPTCKGIGLVVPNADSTQTHT
jgi:hypothetical protein